MDGSSRSRGRPRPIRSGATPFCSSWIWPTPASTSWSRSSARSSGTSCRAAPPSSKRGSAPERSAMQLARTTITTPLGEMLALASDAGLCALEFIEVKKRSRPGRDAAAERERLTRLNARLRRWFPPHEIVDADTRSFSRTRAWLTNYFDGTAADVDDLPLDMRGAGFEKRVWQ